MRWDNPNRDDAALRLRGYWFSGGLEGMGLSCKPSLDVRGKVSDILVRHLSIERVEKMSQHMWEVLQKFVDIDVRLLNAVRYLIHQAWRIPLTFLSPLRRVQCLVALGYSALFLRHDDLLGLPDVQLETRNCPEVANFQGFAERAFNIAAQEIGHDLFEFSC